MTPATPAESLQNALTSVVQDLLRAAVPGTDALRDLLDRPGDLLPDLRRLVPAPPSWEQLAVFALVKLCELGNAAHTPYRFEARAFPAADGWAPSIGVALVPSDTAAGVAPPAAELRLAVFAAGGTHGVRLHLHQALDVPFRSAAWKFTLTGTGGAGVDVPVAGPWSHAQAGALKVTAEYRLPRPLPVEGVQIDLDAATLTFQVDPSAPAWWSVDARLARLQADSARVLGDLSALLQGAVDLDLPKVDYAPTLHVDSRPGSTALVLG